MEAAKRNNDRLLSISDGLFSVGMTLLVVSISVPEVAGRGLEMELSQRLWSLFPRFEIFFISFFVVCFYWLSHHELFHLVEGNNDCLIWLNLFFLMCITLLPFSAGLVGEYSDLKVAVDFYSATMVLTSLALVFLWAYASKAGFVNTSVDDVEKRKILFKLLYPALIFLLSIGVSSFSVRLAKYFWLLIVARGHLSDKLS